MAASPTEIALRECKRNNWTAQKVEYWNHYGRRRVDLFGIIDIVVLDGNPGLLGIQATTRSNISHRFNKIKANPIHQQWLDAGNRLQVWGTYKEKNKWQIKISEIKTK